MKVRSILFILFLFLPRIIFSQLKSPDLTVFEKVSLFDEQFNDNSRNWITGNDYLIGSVSNGGYIIKCKNFRGATALSCKDPGLDYSKDFEIEASFSVIRGSGGLVMGMGDNFFHHRIEINDKQDAFFLKNDIKLTELVAIRKNTFIKSGDENKLTIRKIGSTYFLYINDSFVKDFVNISLDGKSIGFNVGIDSEIKIDYISVSYLNSQRTDLQAKNNIPENVPVISGDVPGDDMVISWISPSAERVNVHEYSVWARGKVKSGSGIESIIFYVNGIPVGQSEFQPVKGEADTYRADKLVNLKPGENHVYFLATDTKKRSLKSDVRYFTNPETNPPQLVWSYPSGTKSLVNTEKINIDAVVKSQTGLVAARIMVNGVPFEENPAALIPNSSGEIRLQREIVLRDGENSIYIAATNTAGSSLSEGRTVLLNRSLKEKRIALIIGNSNYQNNVTLKNPLNDANLMEATLKNLDFKVIKGLNLGYSQMMDSLREFSRRLSDYNVALFYYAGHGIQVDGINYLIPVDAKLADKNDCSWEALAVNKITDEFNKHSTNTNIIILDACRNNPYRSWARGEVNGFKALGPVNGTIISFATSEGSTAADGDGLNGTFTEVLARQMMEPQQIENVFKNTRRIVKERTKDQQVPMEWNYLTEDFYFVKPDIR